MEQHMTNAFNQDKILQELMREWVKKYNISLIVETGTFRGDTSEFLASITEKVITIESNHTYYSESRKKLATVKNIEMHLGDSAKLIRSLNYATNGRVLFFLDAHWGPEWPLLGELESIAKLGLKPVILIHDFKVPNHPEFGYDVYGGQSCEWGYVESHVNAIYGHNVDKAYPERAEGSKRGWILLTPSIIQ